MVPILGSPEEAPLVQPGRMIGALALDNSEQVRGLTMNGMGLQLSDLDSS